MVHAFSSIYFLVPTIFLIGIIPIALRWPNIFLPLIFIPIGLFFAFSPYSYPGLMISIIGPSAALIYSGISLIKKPPKFLKQHNLLVRLFASLMIFIGVAYFIIVIATIPD